MNGLCLGCFVDKTASPVCENCGWDHKNEAESPLYLKPGTVLKEQYLIGRVLGHGGFGITYLAFDQNLKIKLAIKEYLPREYAVRNGFENTVSVHSGSGQQEFAYGLDKFLEEAQNVARFQGHPGIVGVLNFFEANGTGYMVMPYVEGITLKEYLKVQPEQRLSVDKAIGIFMPVMDALREVHNAGMLHRDISPDNIYLTNEGQVKLLDFGAARFAMGEHSKSISIVLKPGYSPKEQYSSKGNQGSWTDVYAVAASLYRTFTGKIPEDALDRAEQDDLISPSKLVEIAPEIEAAILKALNVNWSDRFSSMEEFLYSLSGEYTSKSTKPEKPSLTSNSENAIDRHTDHIPSGSTDTVQVLRRRLIKLGHRIKDSGSLDERAIAAVKKFEENRNLPVIGKVDEVLIQEVEKAYFELEQKNWKVFNVQLLGGNLPKLKMKGLIESYLKEWPDTQFLSELENLYWKSVSKLAMDALSMEETGGYSVLFPSNNTEDKLNNLRSEIENALNSKEEKAEWLRIKRKPTFEDVQAFHERFPRSKFLEVDSHTTFKKLKKIETIKKVVLVGVPSFVSFAVLLTVFWNYSQFDNEAFKIAKSINKISSYEEFLINHPDSEFAEVAETHINELRKSDKALFQEALDKSTKSAFELYLANTHDGVFSEKSKLFIDELVRRDIDSFKNILVLHDTLDITDNFAVNQLSSCIAQHVRHFPDGYNIKTIRIILSDARGWSKLRKTFDSAKAEEFIRSVAYKKFKDLALEHLEAVKYFQSEDINGDNLNAKIIEILERMNANTQVITYVNNHLESNYYALFQLEELHKAFNGVGNNNVHEALRNLTNIRASSSPCRSRRYSNILEL